MTTSVKHTFSHLIYHLTKKLKSRGSSQAKPSHTHTQTHTYTGYCAALHTFPHLTLSGGVWKTGPHKPAGHVDYHFNGLACWKCWFFGAEIIYCSYQSRTGVDKREGAAKKEEQNMNPFIGCQSMGRGVSLMWALCVRSQSRPWISLQGMAGI